MKYVRNLDDLKKYTFEFFDSFLPQHLSDQMVNLFLVDIGNKELLTKATLEYIEYSPLNPTAVAEYGEVILQLLDYKTLLKKFTELLLLSKSFLALNAFLNRIFLQHVGSAIYKSSRKQYSIRERYFDRFIEITMFCKIDKKLTTPFFLEIFNCDESSSLFFFKEPLKEYLDIFLKDGDDDLFIQSLLSSEKREGLGTYASVNTVKTLRTLINEFVRGGINNLSLIRKALFSHKQEGFNIIEEMLQTGNSETMFKAVQLLVLFKDERQIKERLKTLYESLNDAKIKLFLEKECGFNSLENFASKRNFLIFIEERIPAVQERLYGARLKKYYEKHKLNFENLNGKMLTFVMETMKSREMESQFVALKEYLKFVETSDLQKLCRVVYDVATDRHKLFSSKWAFRLFALFAPSDLLEELTDKMKKWFLEKDKEKMVRYFLELLSLSANEEVVEMVKTLKTLHLNPKQKKFLSTILQTFSLKTQQNIQSIKDKISDDLGFDCNGHRQLNLDNRTLALQLNRDCSIKITNAESGKIARLRESDFYEGISVKQYIKSLEKKIKIQRKRLHTAFLEFRNFSEKDFSDGILQNNLLNFLSSHLLWGRYKNDNLAEICLIKNGTLTHLAGNIVMDNLEDYTLAILQPLDCEDIKKDLKNNFATLFPQFDLPVFKEEDLAINATYVDSLSGVFCNAKLFVSRLQKLSYKINDLDARGYFGTLVKPNTNLNLLTCIEFDRVSLGNLNHSITISKVRFFELNKQIKQGKRFILNKTEALILRDLNRHILSNELAQILLACKT